MSRELLQQMVEKLGLAEVSAAIGYTKGAVCHVMRGTYKGRADRILAAVEEKFSQRLVECPVLGQISLARCTEEKARPFSAANTIRVALARTCPRCGGEQ